MGNFKDLTNMDFDRWHVIELAEKRGNNYYYLCKCKCGTEKLVKGSSLVHKKSKSCGCLQKEIAKEKLFKNNRKFNKYHTYGDYVEVILVNTKNIMTCDVDDWKNLKEYCWVEDAYGYAVANSLKGNNKTLRFHDIIMNPPEGMVVDHKNRTPLFNRKSNLRIVTQRINVLNSGMKNTNTSGYTGVRKRKDTGKWNARIMVNYKEINLGCFVNKEDAIEARKKAEKEYFEPLLKEVI